MKKVILITGCSSGFGMETAKYLANKGYTVVPTMRNEDDLKLLPSSVQLDVTWPQDQVNEVIKNVVKKYDRIDCLLNNAGYGYIGSVEKAEVDDVREQLETNFVGTFKVIKAVLPEMKKNKDGLIMNVSSIFGLIAIPDYGVYSASKFAIEGLSKTLRLEMDKFNIKVAVINPGAFMTKFSANGIYGEKKNLGNTSAGMDPIEFAKLVEKIIVTDKPKSNYLIGNEARQIKILQMLPEFLREIIFKKFVA